MRSVFYDLPAGDRGVLLTLQAMRAMAGAASQDGHIRARAKQLKQQARGGLGGVPFPAVLRSWLARHWRFVEDPDGVEQVTAPELLLERIRSAGWAEGDCDDVATLGAALALAGGHRVRFRVVGWGRHYSHVFAEVEPRPGCRCEWVELDVTREAQGITPDYLAAHPPDRSAEFYL